MKLTQEGMLNCSFPSQVTLIDRFEDKVNDRVSYCYRIVYRDHSRTLTMQEVRPLHQEIGKLSEMHLNVKVR